MAIPVLLYIPNLIGYLRILSFLTAAIIITPSDPATFLFFYLFASLLDVFDGWAARKFDQVSLFGAWLDVVVDNVQRGFLWTVVSHRVGYFIAVLEWLTLMSTLSYGSEWKKSAFRQPLPSFVRVISQDGFANPLGYLALVSTHLLPVALFLDGHADLCPLLHSATPTLILLLSLGRCIAASVEVIIPLTSSPSPSSWTGTRTSAPSSTPPPPPSSSSSLSDDASPPPLRSLFHSPPPRRPLPGRARGPLPPPPLRHPHPHPPPLSRTMHRRLR